MNDSPHRIGLGPKILGRARLIFGTLLALVVIISIAGIHQGIQSGDFERLLIRPFIQFAVDLENALEPTPSPAPLALPTLIPTPSPTIIPTYSTPKQSQPVFSNCIRKNIREGEFASNKCYSVQDYEDLEYYLQRFNSSIFSLEGAEASMRITCSGSDFFKDSCERDKQQKSKAEADINNYRGIIQGIIAKGK